MNKEITKELVEQAMENISIETETFAEQSLIFGFFHSWGFVDIEERYFENNAFVEDVVASKYDNQYRYYYLDFLDKTLGATTKEQTKGNTVIKAADFIKHILEYSDKVLIELNPDYTAKVDKNEKVVRVGCQTIPFDKIKELYEATQG